MMSCWSRSRREDREALDELKRATRSCGSACNRCASDATQASVGEKLGTSRPNFTRIENEDDVRVTTLAGYVRALGGRLEVCAIFEDEPVTLAEELRHVRRATDITDMRRDSKRRQ